MNLEELRALAHPPEAGDTAADVPGLHLADDEDVSGVFAWFGEDVKRDRVHLVIGGETAGVLTRKDIYKILGATNLGFGDSIQSRPAGHAKWTTYRLQCPVTGCRVRYALKFDPAHPPQCPEHHQPLHLAP